MTVLEVDLLTLEDELIEALRYRVVNRYEWFGTKHTQLYGRIMALAEHWQARYLVVVATGVRAGQASLLEKGLGERMIPYVFTSKSKSDLGRGFLAVIETGSYKEYQVSGVKEHVSSANDFLEAGGALPEHSAGRVGGEGGVLNESVELRV